MTSLGDLQNLTMLAVARLGPRAFAREIRDTLHEVAGRKVSVSAVFVTLRIFSLTEPGWDALRQTRAASEAMGAGLEPG